MAKNQTLLTSWQFNKNAKNNGLEQPNKKMKKRGVRGGEGEAFYMFPMPPPPSIYLKTNLQKTKN